MKAYRNFCTAHRRALMTISLVSACFSLMIALTACNAPAWLTEAQLLLPVIGASITSVLSFLAGLSGNAGLAAVLAGVTTIITNVGNGLNDLIAAVEAYKENPSDTLLQKIQGIADAISANLQKVLTDSGIPAAIAQKIQAWAQLVVSQMDVWLKIVPQVHAAVMAKNLHMMAKPPKGAKIMTVDQFTAAHNAIWEVPTGDPKVDVELPKAQI
jgi:hypothetical protein